MSLKSHKFGKVLKKSKVLLFILLFCFKAQINISLLTLPCLLPSTSCARARLNNYSEMITFLLMVNKQGQTRLSSYYKWLSIAERVALESEIIRKCLSRNQTQCSFLEFRGYNIVYRRYASLFFIVGTDGNEESGLAMLEFIHTFVETLDKYFESVCELDIMFNIEKAHFILDEMVMGGMIVETNKANVLRPIALMSSEASNDDNIFK